MTLDTGRTLNESFGLAGAIRWRPFPLYVLAALISGSAAWVSFLPVAGVLGVTLVATFVAACAAAVFYQRALGVSEATGILQPGARLFLGSLLVQLALLIIAFFCALFLILMGGIFLGTEGFDPEIAAEDPAEFARSLAAILDGPAGWILSLLLLAALAGLAWIALRLLLFGVGTVARGELVIFQTWGWTEGHVAKLALASLVLVVVPWSVAILLATALEGLLGYEAGVSSVLATFLVEFGASVLAYPVFLLGHGFAVSVFRQLSPDMMDLEGAFD